MSKIHSAIAHRTTELIEMYFILRSSPLASSRGKKKEGIFIYFIFRLLSVVVAVGTMYVTFIDEYDFIIII